MRHRIGETAIKALTVYGYDRIIVEVDDRSGRAICDADQAIPITSNGIDWSQTNYGKEPERPPLTLIDIVSSTMDHQASRLEIDPQSLKQDKKELENIEWGIEA